MSLQKEKEKKKDIKKYKRSRLYSFVKITGALPMLLWLRPKVIMADAVNGLDKKGGVLISANHQGFLDPVLIHCVFWKRTIYSLATKELFAGKWKNSFFRGVHCIPVDRDNFSLDSFHAVCDCLKAEQAVLIFPEGKLNLDETVKMQNLKSGIVLMAYQADKPILPVYLIKRKKWYHRSFVVVGAPISVREICGSRPSMEAINRVNMLLKERELELEKQYEEEVKHGKNHF